MKNLSIEQQKEFEKMIAEINKLHNELNYLVKENREREQRDNNIKKSLIKEIDNLKKENLELITENNEINKRLSSYEKYNDMPSEEEIEKQYKEYYSSLENELYYE